MCCALCPYQDPQRRKLLPYAFYQSVDGYTTLQCSGTLYVARQPSDDEQIEDEAERADSTGGGQVHVVCSADVLLPFIASTSPLELLEDTSISILPATTSSPQPSSLSIPTSHWWLCDLLRCDDVPGVQSAIDQLTHSSNEWAVGWQAQPPPSSATSSATALSISSCAVTPRRKRSAATFAVLRVRQQLHPKQYRSTTAVAAVPTASSPSLHPNQVVITSQVALLPAGFPSFPPLTFVSARSLRRGSDVHVVASPYGLLSPAVFHNSVSGGIVSNVVHPPSSAYAVGVELQDGSASHDSVVMQDSVAPTAFPSADVSFPRHLHFPIQGHPLSSSPVSASPSAAAEQPRSFASVFLTDCRCLPGSEGGPVVLASPLSNTSDSVLLAGLVTLPLHLTNALSPVLLNNVVTAEAVWHWLCQDERTTPHYLFHSLAPPSAAAVVTSPTSSTAAPIAFLSSHPSQPSISTKTVSASSLSPSPVSASRLSVSGMVERAERSLAIAKVQSSWASAIVLTADGYIATNAHLLAPFHTTLPAATDEPKASTAAPLLSAAVSVCLSSSNRYQLSSRHWYKATVVYVCRSPWDLALLKIDPPAPLTPVALPQPTSQPARPGDPVYVLGHALFSPSSMLLPTLTRGVLSQCVSLAASSSSAAYSPVLLQTDSAVHNGNSGGLLLSRTGVCLGMVTSNIQHTAMPTASDSFHTPPPPSTSASANGSVIIPQLNLSIPAAVLLRLRSQLKKLPAASLLPADGGSSAGDSGGVVAAGGDIWHEWEAGESGWREEVERMWGLSVVDVWELDVKPRSAKYRAVVEVVQRMEQEKDSQEAQQQQVGVLSSSTVSMEVRLSQHSRL